jgi:hypothetical protein
MVSLPLLLSHLVQKTRVSPLSKLRKSTPSSLGSTKFHQVPPSGVSRWFDLDYFSFQAWCTLPALVPQGVSPASISLPSSAIYDSRKIVKRSVSDYQVFKEDRPWQSWHWHLLTTARSHNVDNVLNLLYSPTDPDDVALLQEQKRSIFSILEQKVQTSDGLIFLHVHSSSGDATAVYKDIVERYSKSTAAQLSASEIKEDHSTFRLNDTWKKSNPMFLNAWATKFKPLLSHRNGFGLLEPLHPSLCCSPCPFPSLKPLKS